MKTTLYVYPRLLYLCLCAPALMDIGIRCIKTVSRPTCWPGWPHGLTMLSVEHCDAVGIGIALSLGVHPITWGKTSIFAIPYTCIECTTLVVATLSIRVNYNYKI